MKVRKDPKYGRPHFLTAGNKTKTRFTMNASVYGALSIQEVWRSSCFALRFRKDQAMREQKRQCQPKIMVRHSAVELSPPAPNRTVYEFTQCNTFSAICRESCISLIPEFLVKGAGKTLETTLCALSTQLYVGSDILISLTPQYFSLFCLTIY